MALSTPRVLVVEDEPALGEGLGEALRHLGYEVELATDGVTGLERAQRGAFDVLLLDLMLPRLSGFDLLERLRQGGSKLPTIILTAKGGEADRVRGLTLGADDYVAKPFSLPELVARVGAQVRRARMDRGDGETFEACGMVFDLGRLSVQRGDETLLLTPREGEILRHLRARTGNVVTRDEFLLEVWKYPTARVETRTVDNTLATLRRKLERDAAAPQLILTVRGLGYRWGG